MDKKRISNINIDISGLYKKSELFRRIVIWIFGGIILSSILEITNLGLFEFIYLLLGSFMKVFIGYLIILILTSPVLMCKKKWTAYIISSFFIVILGIINYMCIKFRGTQLGINDIYVIPEAISMVKDYISIGIMGILLASLIIIVAFIIFIGKRERKSSIKCKKWIFLILLIMIWSINILIGKNTELCINNSLIPIWEKTIGSLDYYQIKAGDIDLQQVDKTYEEINEKIEPTKADKKPNIIVVQLESLFDYKRIKNIEIREDVLQNYRKIKEVSQYGIVDVPTFGGGTVRSEFEMLTGYNLDLLSSSNIPNSTFLKKVKIESMASILGKEGYDTTLLHNFKKSFYDRDKCYKNLGFDEFIGLEDMGDVERKYGFPVDISNFKYVKECIEKDAPQFIYNITLEGHGNYKNKGGVNTNLISGINDEEVKDELSIYLDKIRGTDYYLGELFEYLNTIDEPTVLVLFGDHLPNLEIVDYGQNIEGDLYSTEYVIWNNMGCVFDESEKELYLLGGSILDTLEINMGTIWTFYKNKDYWDNSDKLIRDIQWTKVKGW